MLFYINSNQYAKVKNNVYKNMSFSMVLTIHVRLGQRLESCNVSSQFRLKMSRTHSCKKTTQISDFCCYSFFTRNNSIFRA